MPFPNIGPGELILILIIALVLLGPGKLPDVAQSLGKSVREFRRAATDVTEAGKLDTQTQSPNDAGVAASEQPEATLSAPAAEASADTSPAEPAKSAGDSNSS